MGPPAETASQQASLDAIDLTDLDLFTEGFPHEVFTELRRSAPVFWHQPTSHTPDGEGFWVLSRYHDIHAAAADSITFSSDRGGLRDGGGTLIEDLPAGFASGVLLNMMDDPRHQRIRALVTPAVSPRALAAMEAELRDRAEMIVESAVAKGDCDFVVDVAAELPLQAIARLLGVPQADRHRLFQWATTGLDYTDHDLGQTSARTEEAHALLAEYAGWLIAEKRSEPGDDMLSAVVHGSVDGEPLSDLEHMMFFNLLIAAGSETTRNSIAIGMRALIEHPDQWSLLDQDRSLLPSAVEEMLRWASPTAYNRRTASRDVEVGSQLIRAGEKVTLWWASANRDEHEFADPFRFDVLRDPNRHLAFGHGSHFCLGARLARLEMLVLFSVLLDGIEAVELTGPFEWTRSNKHTGVRHMPVRLSPKATK
ncbi:MAG: cytochrome P450 [Acidimicrobiales bacterium]|nr:cytochrome P450 [Acidimicrobiales bacterium]